MRGLRFGGLGAVVALLVVGLLVGLVGPVSAQVRKVGGWARVPGGTVWLEPGRQAYEHDTGLVRDLATGQKNYPIRPSTELNYSQPLAYSVPQVAPQVVAPVVLPQVGPRLVAPAVPLVPFQVPQVYQPYANPYYVPQYQFNSRNSIDIGPYGAGGCSGGGCGAIATHGAIRSQWRKVQ